MPPLAQAFAVAAGELGMVSAARLFIRTCAGAGGAEAVGCLLDQAGPSFPVLDAAARAWLAASTLPALDPAPVAALLARCSTIVVAGFESEALDRLCPALADQSILVLTHGALPGDWERMLANYRGRLGAVDLDGLLDHAGAGSALLCFATGGQDGSLFVPESWLRVQGPDTRTLFSRLVAWNLLPCSFQRYPRWQAEVLATQFTDLV